MTSSDKVPAALANSVAMRREATHCKRGHSNWGWRKAEDGIRYRRYCITCKKERYRVGKPLRGPFGLRPEEIAVLQAAADGFSVAQAAERFSYCKASIVDQRARALRKLKVNNATHAVAKALRYGIIN